MFGTTQISAATDPANAPGDWAFEASSIELNNAIIARYPSIDSNGDGFISESEAQAYSGAISLSYRSLTGTMNGIENFSQVTELYLNGNNLSGEIPSGLENLSNLTSLYLSYNQLGGEIPASLGNLSNLTALEVANNQLSGEVPTSLGNLTNLTSLELVNNQLSGELPESLNNLTKLQLFEIGANHFTSIKQSTYEFLISRVNMHYMLNNLNYIDNLTTTGAIDTDFEFDGLPAYEQFPNYAIEFRFTLVSPDTTSRVIEPSISNGKVVIAGSDLSQLGNYTLVALGTSDNSRFSDAEYTTNFTIQEAATASYKVTFNPENGIAINDWEELEVVVGELIPTITAPQKEGYTFVGWASGYGANNEPVFWDFETDVMPDFNIMLWAEYEKTATSGETEEETSNPNSGNNTGTSEEKNSSVLQNNKTIETGSNNSSVMILLMAGLLISGGYLIINRKRNK